MRLAVIVTTMLLLAATPARAEVFVRWMADRVPPRDVLGIATLALPAENTAAVRDALGHGYRVYLEVDAAALSAFKLPSGGVAGVLVRGSASARAISTLRQQLPRSVQVLTIDERGKWPRIRSNTVSRSNGVLQIAGRSAQPWIDTNAALARIAATKDARPLLTYRWTPAGIAEADEGPALENYLVAIAEAGSFRADLLLPLHERFQHRMLLGHPTARRDWDQIRRSLDFYAGDFPSRYEPIASIGVVTAAPAKWFEVMNLLARHNLPFEPIAPERLAARAGALPKLRLLLVLGEPDPAQKKTLAAFERGGGVVRTETELRDPNRLALDIRRQLSVEARVLDIWNGITVVAAPYAAKDGSLMLITLVNYAHQPLPVQLRVAGTFSEVYYETPEEPPALLAFEHRNGATEFVLPSLRVGARIFLSRRP